MTPTSLEPPRLRPRNPCFSSGPCAKRPGWSPELLAGALLGRSHRAAPAKARIKAVIERSKALLGAPEDYRLAIVPGSDTGAIEMALWSMLGARGVDMLAWDSFGKTWVKDATDHLKLDDVRVMEADYGALPDLAQVDWSRDVVFTWNGTTAGVRVPDGDWIAADREGLAICDATSAVFGMAVPVEKLDVVTWSWQKALGGEAGHGMLLLSPRAVERLERYAPPRPLPKLFRLTKGGKLDAAIFEGATINTPSMLCVEDALDTLDWAEGLGGLEALIGRAAANLAAVEAWVAATPWVDFLAEAPSTRSPTSICLKVVDPWFRALAPEAREPVTKGVVALLDAEGIAHDVGSYRGVPPGFRIWGGATVERDDIAALLPWLDWAYARVKAERAEAA